MKYLICSFCLFYLRMIWRNLTEFCWISSSSWRVMWKNWATASLTGETVVLSLLEDLAVSRILTSILLRLLAALGNQPIPTIAWLTRPTAWRPYWTQARRMWHHSRRRMRTILVRLLRHRACRIARCCLVRLSSLITAARRPSEAATVPRLRRGPVTSVRRWGWAQVSTDWSTAPALPDFRMTEDLPWAETALLIVAFNLPAKLKIVALIVW